MALLYAPGDYMPTSTTSFRHHSWLMGWTDGPYCMHDLEPGGTVYLVDVAHQTIVWETRVTQSFAVPFEALGGLVAEVRLRWGLEIEPGTLPPGGFCVGWRAEPVERVDRRPMLDVVDAAPEDLHLDGFQFSHECSPLFRRCWGLPDAEAHWCDGRPRLGWFGTPVDADD
jgi:hypothetical protein